MLEILGNANPQVKRRAGIGHIHRGLFDPNGHNVVACGEDRVPGRVLNLRGFFRPRLRWLHEPHGEGAEEQAEQGNADQGWPTLGHT